MSAGAIANFLALLLLGGAVLLVASMLTSAGRRSVATSAPRIAAVIAVGATAASLYFSEVAGFAPCELCWFQRIAMYPLAVILPIAVVRGDSVRPYALALAVLGFGIAAYHVQLQAFPDQGSFCELANPCTSSPIKALGVFTIPQMSGLSFAGIVALSLFKPITSSEKQSPEVAAETSLPVKGEVLR